MIPSRTGMAKRGCEIKHPGNKDKEFVLFCFVLFCFVLFCYLLFSFLFFSFLFFSFLFFSFFSCCFLHQPLISPNFSHVYE